MALTIEEEELRNVKILIDITSRNIDALNAKFAHLNDPPSIFVTEIKDLKSILTELEEKKNEIVGKLRQNDSVEQHSEYNEVNKTKSKHI